MITPSDSTGSASPPRSRRRRRARNLAVLGLGLVVLWLGMSWVVARQLVARRHRPFAEPPPAVAWGTVEPVRLTTRDGHQLGAWLHRGRPGEPAVLLLHGNGGRRADMLNRAGLLAGRGCSTLLVTLRAHGDSTGESNDIGFGARADVLAAVDYLERTHPGAPIVILGSSLGGAAAAFASGELGHRVSGYILESPFADLKTALWNRLDNALPSGFAAVIYTGLLAVSPLILPHLDRISPCEAIAGVPDGVPVLILAGALDRRARPEEAEAILQRVRSHGRLVLFDGADHVRMFDADLALYCAAVFGLIDEVSRPK